MSRSRSYTDEFLLKKLSEAATALGNNLSHDNFKKLKGFPSVSVYHRRFGSWRKSLELIGITNIKKCQHEKGSPEAHAWGQRMQTLMGPRPIIKKQRFAKFRIRFEVLHRDNFTCQYCGRTPKDGAKLVVDHLDPYINGGLTNKDNLITSCFECNAGKSDLILSLTPPL